MNFLFFLTVANGLATNNPQKISPPHLLFPQEEKIDDKWLISVLVPASSQVHQVGGKVYLRSEDGDYQLNGTNQLAGLMNLKLSFFTEQRVYPYLGLSDLDPTLFEKAIQIGRYEELGSGVRKVNHYLPHYAPGAGKPLFIDGNMFEVIVPIGEAKPAENSESTPINAAVMESGAQSGAQSLEILSILNSEDNLSSNELADLLNLKSKTGAFKRSLQALLEDKRVEYTIPDKPTSRLQKYRLTAKGRALLTSLNQKAQP